MENEMYVLSIYGGMYDSYWEIAMGVYATKADAERQKEMVIERIKQYSDGEEEARGVNIVTVGFNEDLSIVPVGVECCISEKEMQEHGGCECWQCEYWKQDNPWCSVSDFYGKGCLRGKRKEN